MMDEITTWFGRIVRLIPEIVGLWEAAKSQNPQQELAAQLALTRKMKDEQAHEEIG